MPLTKFGGLNSFMSPANLPVFASPDCQDVEFINGLVQTRPGYGSSLGINATVNYNYLKTYVSPMLAVRTLALDSLGVLWKESPFNSLVFVAQIENTGIYANSVSLYGREYLAFGDQQYGTSIPRQFDDSANLDRVSQVGPGAPPVVTDENIVLNLANSPTGATMPAPVAITAISEVSDIVTVTTATAHGITPQHAVFIAGVGVTAYNGRFAVVSIISSTQFTYQSGTPGLAPSSGGTSQLAIYIFTTTVPHNFGNGQLVTTAGVGVTGYNATLGVNQVFNSTQFAMGAANAGLAASGGGTVTPNGSIVAGLHQVSVIFQDREGYLTQPAPAGNWTAGGGNRAVVSNIPIGPANIVARILIFTAVNQKSFYFTGSGSPLYSGNMVINNNTFTTVTVDFTDAVLLEGVNVDDLFDLVELGECAGVTAYEGRLFWWGERNKLNNLVNLTFDGGFSTIGGKNIPLGWTATTSGFLGGKGPTAISGNSYGITGDGATAVIGMITQTAYLDQFGQPIINKDTAYSVRVRLAYDPSGVPFTQGTFHIHLYSPSSIFDVGLDVAASALTSSFQEFIGVLTPKQPLIPTDLLLRVYMDGTPTSGAILDVENIEIFPTTQPYNNTLVRASRVPDALGLYTAESYNGVDGLLDIAPDNGQAVRCVFTIRDFLYFAKERSLYVTANDSSSEPANWDISEISLKVGTLSPRGVGIGDEWAVIAGIDGVYYFDGSAPQKLSQEIQPTWDSINWNYGHLVDVKVDTKRKRVYIDVPMGTSTVPNVKLTLDYTDGFGDPNPTSTVNIAGIGRKWCPWNISSNSQNLCLRADGTLQLMFGNNTGTGKIYQLDPPGIAIFGDDGVAINSYWQSGFFQDEGRLNFGYLTANAIGVGTLNLILRRGDQGWISNIRGWLFTSMGFYGMERQINVTTDRLAVRFGTNAQDSYFSMRGLALYAKAATYAPVRGLNAA